MGSSRRESVPAHVNLSASAMLMIAMQYTSNPGKQEPGRLSSSQTIMRRHLTDKIESFMWELLLAEETIDVLKADFGVKINLSITSSSDLVC